MFVPYTDLSKITFFEDGLSADSNKNIWAQFTLKTLDRDPFSQLMDPDNTSFYLFLPYVFIKDHYKRLVEIYGETEV